MEDVLETFRYGDAEPFVEHVVHGDVHDRDEEDDGPDEAVLHGFHFFLGYVRGTLLRSAGLFLTAAFGRAGSVAGVDDGLDDVLLADDIFIVRGLHTVGQQVDAGLVDAVQLVDGFFHAGRAGGTAHARDVEFFVLQRTHSFIS